MVQLLREGISISLQGALRLFFLHNLFLAKQIDIVLPRLQRPLKLLVHLMGRPGNQS